MSLILPGLARPQAPETAPEALPFPPRWAPAARVALLASVDLACVLASGAVAYLLWARLVLGQGGDLYAGLLPLALVFPAAYASWRLYPGFGLGAVETLRSFTFATSISFLLVGASSFVLKAESTYSRMTFFIAWLASLALVPLGRFAALGLLGRLRWWAEPVVLVGDWRGAEWLVSSLPRAFSLGFRPIGRIDDRAGRDGALRVPFLGGLDRARELASAGVKIALVRDGPGARGRVERLRDCFRHVILVEPEGSLPVETARVYNLGGVFGLEVTNRLLEPRWRKLKRASDVVLGSVLLLAALPVIAISALLVRLASRGPAFYSQERGGAGGKAIRVWKVRTMYADAEERLERHLASDPAARAEWETYMKLRADPRVIRGIGAFLRRFSLDELPQLWSVVKGEMSLVGPRPFPHYHLTRFPEEFRKLRATVPPGLTGMWQVMARSEATVEEQQIYDTYYIRNWSLWLDAYILARTAISVLAGKGAA